MIRNNQANDTTTEGLNKIGSSPYQPPKRYPSPPPPRRHPSPLPQRRHPDPAQPKQKPAPKILFIGDSVSASANIKVVEEATRAKVVTSKAYSAIHDEVSNVAKNPAFYPHKNFTDVIPKEVVKDTFDYLVLQSGSVDISNLNTKVNANLYLDYFQQEAVISAKNTFNAGVQALKQQPTLQKVLIMKQIPRHDPKEVDPLGIKTSLSQLFNSTMMEQWMNSPHKERIFIGNHNLECSGASLSSRYKCTKTGKFDGIHLYGSSGSKFYTLSMLSILRTAGLISSEHDYHLSCAQYQYQNKQQRQQKNC